MYTLAMSNLYHFCDFNYVSMRLLEAEVHVTQLAFTLRGGLVHFAADSVRVADGFRAPHAAVTVRACRGFSSVEL